MLRVVRGHNTAIVKPTGSAHRRPRDSCCFLFRDCHAGVPESVVRLPRWRGGPAGHPQVADRRLIPRLASCDGPVFPCPRTMADAPEIRPAQLDPSPVPEYALPDPLRCDDGTRIKDAASWAKKRRRELLEHFAREVYGRTRLGRPESQRVTTMAIDPHALGGRATRKEFLTAFSGDAAVGPSMRILLYVPNGTGRKPHPLFLGLNFYGNHTVAADPGVALQHGWIPDSPGVVDHRATEAARGSDAARWQIGSVLARGHATATIYCGELCPDRTDGLADGVNGWFFRDATESRPADAWGAIGVWAWGLSRALDVLAADPDIDPACVFVHGHSRLGKAALWAGAQDERFALVIANESGCGGASLSKRIHGETVARINATFPHWFARNFRRYSDDEAALPVDQHELLALVAPRPLCIGSAEGDDWADPRGEFLAVKAAEPVYALFGFPGLGVNDVPPVHRPAGSTLRYHIRAGEHDMTAFDWSCYLAAADQLAAAAR